MTTTLRSKERIFPVLRSSLLSLVIAVLYGCATPPYVEVRIDEENLSRLIDEKVIWAIHYTPSSFSASPFRGSGRGGLVGALFEMVASDAIGQKMVRDYSLPDPALRVKQRFVSALAARLGFLNVHDVPEPVASDDLAGLKKTFVRGVVIDFQTENWDVSEIPEFLSFRTRVSVHYRARSRLVRLEDSRILWEAVCYVGEADPKKGVAWEALIADNGARLKTILHESADKCADDLSALLVGTRSEQ